MRKFLIPLAAASAALVTAAPASAQGYYGGHNPGRHYGQQGDHGLAQRFNQQIGQLESRIQRSAQRQAISPREYRSLRNHAAQLRQRLHRFARNGLNRGEAQDIANRIDDLRGRIREERRDGRGGW